MCCDKSTPSTTSYATSLKPNDVLLGRGVPYFTYSGNVSFRELAKERKHQYSTCGNRDMKHQLAQDIITIIAERDDRFLREIIDPIEATALGVSPGTKAWAHVDTSTIVQKLKQAMREPDTHPSQSETGNNSKKISSTPRSSDFISVNNLATTGSSVGVIPIDHILDVNHHAKDCEHIMIEKQHIINNLMKRRQHIAVKQEIAGIKLQSLASSHNDSVHLMKQLYHQDLERNALNQQEELASRLYHDTHRHQTLAMTSPDVTTLHSMFPDLFTALLSTLPPRSSPSMLTTTIRNILLQQQGQGIEFAPHQLDFHNQSLSSYLCQFSYNLKSKDDAFKTIFPGLQNVTENVLRNEVKKRKAAASLPATLTPGSLCSHLSSSESVKPLFLQLKRNHEKNYHFIFDTNNVSDHSKKAKISFVSSQS
jgi:hypothetical protein